MKITNVHLAIFIGVVTAASHSFAAEEKNGSAELRCLPIHQIKSTEVVDNQTIRFKLKNGRVYENHLPQRCGGLDFDKTFKYETSLSELCSVDLIYPINYAGGQPMTSTACSLGMFAPSEPRKKATANH